MNAVNDINTACKIIQAGLPADTQIILFGSQARGDARANSDIDIAIQAHSPLTTGALSLIRDQLEESHLPQRVDIVNLQECSAELRDRIAAEGTLWNGSKSA